MQLEQTIAIYAHKASDLADWMETALPEGLTVFSFLKQHRRRIRTTNYLERTHAEVKRRALVVRIFPNPESCLRLVSEILMEISEDW